MAKMIPGRERVASDDEGWLLLPLAVRFDLPLVLALPLLSLLFFAAIVLESESQISIYESGERRAAMMRGTIFSRVVCVSSLFKT